MNLKKTLALAGASALALSLVSCSGDKGSTDDTKAADGTTSAAAEASSGIVTVYGSEPQNPLIPQDTNETGGGKVLDLIFSGLIRYDEKGGVHNEMAESITPNADSSSFTIKLRPNQKFSDGSPVNADSFIDAWNYAAQSESVSSWFFEAMKGFKGGEKISSLKKIDDLTFKFDLNQPESDFPLRLGYSAFYPLPKAAFKDKEAYGQNPIGNGPYKLAKWEHNRVISVVPNDKYTGDQKVKNGGINFVIYPTIEAAYTDLLAGSLDVLDAIPTKAQTTFKSELGKRALVQPSAVFQAFTIPETLNHFKDDEEGRLRRAAISMSLNRKLIIDKLFAGLNKPAQDFTSPVIDGWTGDIPGNEVLKFDPDKAKALWAKANAISPYKDTFTLAYNADGGHQQWVDAVVNQIKNTLSIPAEGKPYPDFKSFRDDIKNRRMTGAFRTGWQADYPALSNFLGPVFAKGAGSNDGDYDSPEFDAMLKEAAKAPDVKAGNKIYNKSQEILMKDLPEIPLYYGVFKGGYGEDVSNVKVGWDSVPIYSEIIKK